MMTIRSHDQYNMTVYVKRMIDIEGFTVEGELF